MNSSVTLNLEAVLVAYLTPLCTFAASVTGMSSRAHADEDQYGILGEYVAVPAVIVSVEGGENEMPTVPVINAAVTITVRSSTEQSTVATHNANAITVSDAMLDEVELYEAISNYPGLTLSAIYPEGQRFTREGRKLETSFPFKITISSKETP